MSLSGETKKTVALLLAVWPVMIGVGWLAGQVSGTRWPIGVMAVGWLAVLFVLLSKAEAGED